MHNVQPKRYARLVVRSSGYEIPDVALVFADESLGEVHVDLAMLLASDGLEITTTDTFNIPMFEVRMKFAAGALDLDFDVDLLRDLLERAEAKSA